MSRGRAAALATLLLAAACEAKVVELELPDAAARCEKVTRAQGSACTICFSANGRVATSDCPAAPPAPPPPVAPGSPGMTVPPSPPAPSVCKVTPMPQGRCLVCSEPNQPSVTACLKCGPDTSLGASGEVCRACVWSDQGQPSCLQCFATSGATTYDDCDKLRKEQIVYPADGSAPAP